MSDRRERLQYDAGHYRHCRHYQAKSEAFFCQKYQKEKNDCHECTTCPNCDGLLVFYGREISIRQHDRLILEAYSCCQCGAYLERTEIAMKAPASTSQPDNMCEVAGCKNTAYEGHEHHEIGIDIRKFRICESHHRKLKTWRYSAKGLDQKPLLLSGGKIVDNPKYQNKREGRKAS